MNTEDHVLQLVEFFRTLFLDQNRGSYLAAELVTPAAPADRTAPHRS